MEILVTIVAFWLILAGAYGVYSIVQERSTEPAGPRMRQRSSKRPPMIGPFEPPTLPESRTPSFLVQRPRFSNLPSPEEPAASVEEELAPPEPVTASAAPAPRRDTSEVDFLRAQVEHLRSEVYALSATRAERFERPQQRRYRTGNYTHLPRVLKRQVNEVRDFRRHA